MILWNGSEVPYKKRRETISLFFEIFNAYFFSLQGGVIPFILL